MKKSPAVAGFVYAIHSPETPSLVKLGLSVRPSARLKQLQTGNPHKLALIWEFPCPDMSAAERLFHETFDRYRIPGGEWFDFQPNDDPEHIASILTMLAGRHLAESADLRAAFEGIEGFINRPTGFPKSQEYRAHYFSAERPDSASTSNLPA